MMSTKKRRGVPLHVWVDPELDAALDDYLNDTEPSVRKTAAVETAVREFLRLKGYWPRRPEKENE